MRKRDWPHGLRCMDCGRRLSPGQRYSKRLTGMADEVPVVEIVCVECALPLHGTGQEGC